MPGGDAVLADAVAAEAAGRVERIGNFSIYGNEALVGSSFQRNILLLEAEKKGSESVGRLLNAMECEAKAAGATELRIIGYATKNSKLLNEAIAKRFGYQYRLINDELKTIEIVKQLETK